MGERVMGYYQNYPPTKNIAWYEDRVLELEDEVDRLRADAAYGRTAMDEYGSVQAERDRLRDEKAYIEAMLDSAVDQRDRLRESLERIENDPMLAVIPIKNIARQALEGSGEKA